MEGEMKNIGTGVFRATLNASLAGTGGNAYTNASKQLLVIEMVSGIGSSSPINAGAVVPSNLVVLNTGDPTDPSYLFFGPTPPGGIGLPTIHEVTKIYVKPGETIQFQNVDGVLSLSGHFE
jgi:hypothetical protein